MLDYVSAIQSIKSNITYISSSIGILGGLLGAWTFIDNYLLKFNPKIFCGNGFLIKTIRAPYLKISAIYLTLDISNNRKRIGNIYDVAARIYRSDIINPDTAIYYASEIIDKIPDKKENIENSRVNFFTPLTILPNSNKAINIVCSKLINRTEMTLDSSDNSFIIELYYQKENKGDWIKIDNYFLFNGKYNAESEFIFYENDSNSYDSRDKLTKSTIPPKTHVYKGVVHYKFLIFCSVLKFYFFTSIITKIRQFFVLLFVFIKFITDITLDHIIKIPVIKNYAKKLKKFRSSMGNAEYSAITENEISRIDNLLNKYVTQFNKNAEDSSQISLSKDKAGHIVLSRNNQTLHIYKSGDGYIHANTLHDSRVLKDSIINYNLSIKFKILGQYCWYLDNYGYISIRSFVIRILDSFVFHSGY